SLSTHADETLDVVVPGLEVGVADWPVDAHAVAGIGGEVQVAPAIALPAPRQRAAADLIAADPVEALDLGVGMRDIVDEEVRVGGVDEAGAPLDVLFPGVL